MTAHLSGEPRTPAPVSRGRRTTVVRRALASRNARVGATLCLLVCVAAACAPWLAPYSPTAQDLTAGLLPPSPQHLFGTDQLGRDVFSRVLFAARTDLGIALAAAITPFVTGVSLGLVSGYVGRTTDWVISRVTDTVIAFPFYVLVIALIFAVGAGAPGIIVTFALVGWVGYTRVIRALTAAMRQQGWVRAARGAGLSHVRILVRHLLPNVLPQAVVLLATEIVLIMVAIVTLGFLGLGVQPPTPDWGTMIADGQAFVTSHWWLSVLPGLAVIVTGIGLSLLGDGVGDALRVSGSAGTRAPGSGWREDTRSRRAEPAMGHEPEAPAGALRVRGLAIAASPAGRRGAAAGDTPPASPLVGGPDAAGLSLRVDPGQALGIVGESGSGKSLTLRAIAGLLPAGARQVAGKIEVGGRCGMVFQDPLSALDPLTRVGTQLREACRAAGVGDPAPRVRELLAAVRLPDADRMVRAYPHELSGGQRQRVVIAMALAGDPAVLLADEPTTALDVTVQREVLTLLTELRRERGLTLVLVSHDLGVVANMCDRILVMRAGEIVEAGSTRSILGGPEHPYTRELLAAVPRPPTWDTDRERAGQRARLASAPSSRGVAGAGPEPPLTLRVRDLRVRYGGRDAVAGVSFDVRRSLGLVGESGSGKTSIARAIAGELPISAGSVTLAGAPSDAAPGSRASHRTAIQLVPQDPGASLNPRMRVGTTLAEVVRVHWGEGRGAPSRSDVRSRVGELLAEVGLQPTWEHAYPHELSGGQRQRVAIARALAASPRLLIADEATSALDVSVQAAILSLLRRLRDERGVALLVISHDLAVVHALCDDVVVLRAGQVVEQGPNTLLDPAEPYTRELLTAVPRLPA